MSLISVTTLHNLLNTPLVATHESLCVIFVNTESSVAGPKPRLVQDNPERYIPQSLYFDLACRFTNTANSLPNTMVSQTVFEREVGALGINEYSKVVVYDDYGNFYASRVWFMFKAMGHKDVSVLDGGLNLWLKSSLPTSSILIKPSKPKQYRASLNAQYQFVNSDYVLSAISNKDIAIIDARSLSRFTGQEQESRPHLRSGHIPSATSMHYASLLDENKQFLSQRLLIQKFSGLQASEWVFSCGSGITACILAQGADLIGLKNLRVYDGSWAEWGINDILPISIGL